MRGRHEVHIPYNFEGKNKAWAIRHDQMHISGGFTGGATERAPHTAPPGQRVRDAGWPRREGCRDLASPANEGTSNQSGPCTASRQQRIDDFPPMANSNNVQPHADDTSS